MKKVALMSLLVLLLAVPAFAGPPNYVVLKGGIYSPGHEDMTAVANGDFGVGFNGEVAFGHYFTPNIALELGVGYLQSKSATYLDNGVSTSIDISSIPVTLSIKGVIPFPQGEVYALVGGGAYISSIDWKQGTTESKDGTAFGFQAGIGGSYNVTQEVYLGLEGKYFWAQPEFKWASGTDKVHIDGFQGTINLGFRF